MVTSLGHVGIVCDDFLKMRDFYTRVIGLTITDEDPERGGDGPADDSGIEVTASPIVSITRAKSGVTRGFSPPS